MKRTTRITSLSTIKARNLMRGLISNEDPSKAIRALEKIRTRCSEAEFRRALLVLRGNDLFTTSAIGRDFNKQFPRLVGKGVTEAFSPNKILNRINENSRKLADLLEVIVSVIEQISLRNFSAAIRRCRDLINEEGTSLAVLRYLQFIRNHTGADRDLTKQIDEILDEASVDNVRYVANVMRELSSVRTDYFNISDRILKAELSVGVLIAKTFLDAIPRAPGEFASAFSSLYCVSLLDAFLYLARLQGTSLDFVPILEKDLVEAYGRCSLYPSKFEDLYDNSDAGFGLEFFKETFLLAELNDAFTYRTIHAALFNASERKEDGRTSYERLLMAEYFKDANQISKLGSENSAPRICIQRYASADACHFQNSTALVYLLERSDGDIGEDESDFVRAMSRTMSIGTVCPQQYIESIKLNARSPELKIVASALSHIKRRSQLNEHELRSVLQGAAMSSFGGNYTKLLEYIYEISPAVAEHLVSTSDETFLSKMFQIMKNPNAAIQERASILEWYGSKVGDPMYGDRAKNLRIDVQISKERGTIDDSRIHVDPVKFTQWVSNHVLDRFAVLLDSLPQPVEALHVQLEWDKVKTGIGAYEQLGSLILECYEEFCSNKVYGIAAYLGRRIRHGTLKGTGYSDVSAFHTADKYKNLFGVAEFQHAYENWLSNYAVVLEDLRDKYLYIQSKGKPEGLILLDFRSQPKRTAAMHLLHDILKSFSVKGSCAEIPYLVLEYCWRIVEVDLSAIRKLVMEKKSQHGVFRAARAIAQHCRQRERQDFCQELNSVTVERFRTIEGWFRKPSIASPSADITLLFKAVVSEVKSQFSAFRPRMVVDEHGFILDGGTYHVIYDALFILIYNAAENGNPVGKLEMGLGLEELSGKKQVRINIFSEIIPGQQMHDVISSINSALQEDCEDAMVVEGRSGIKKLRKMEQDGYIGRVAYAFDDETVSASFSFALDY